jgi:hypothetical protein
MTTTTKPRPRDGDDTPAATTDRTARILAGPMVSDTVLSNMLDVFMSTTGTTAGTGPDLDEEPARAPYIALLLDEQTCPCGARAHPPHPACRKCRDRARWERRANSATRRAARQRKDGTQ